MKVETGFEMQYERKRGVWDDCSVCVGQLEDGGCYFLKGRRVQKEQVLNRMKSRVGFRYVKFEMLNKHPSIDDTKLDP